MRLKIAFSPCPNDTLIFYGIVNKKINLKGIEFIEYIFDVETLNEKALREDFDVTKLSVGGYLHVRDQYEILSSGSAIGMGCGPLLIAREKIDIRELDGTRIGIPGRFTTANLLFNLFLEEKMAYYRTSLKFIPEYMIFSDIIPGIISGRLTAGVIIHEQRFTYRTYGLTEIIDLGEWWQERTSLPVPLGCICMKRKYGREMIELVNGILRDSVLYGINHIEEAMPYIRLHSQELSEDVIRSHIGLYVNNYTIDMQDGGRMAINKLIDMAERGVSL